MKNSRGWMIWGALALCAAMVLGAMGWLTRSVLAAEKERAGAEARADLEERTRLALWRMDAEGTAILLAENRIPPGDYRHGSDFVGGRFKWTLPPLSTVSDPLIHLHFETSADSAVTSPELESATPEAPAEAARVAAAKDRLKRLTTILSAHPLPLDNGQLLRCAVQTGEASWQAVAKDNVQEKSLNTGLRQQKGNIEARRDVGYQTNFNDTERAQRAKAIEQTVTNGITEQIANPDAGDGAGFLPSQAFPAPTPADSLQIPSSLEPGIETGMMRAVWIGGELFLLRQVRYRGSPPLEISSGPSGPSPGPLITIVQGVWLDSALLRQRLLAEVADLLPAANLAALPGENGLASASAGDPLALVSFPFRLQRNEALPAASASLGGPLLIGWIAVLCALAAVAVMVRGIMRLSERRASFVSAVTHELRTPLTTFQLYSDMLQSGAVKEEKRGEYFRTLHREAGRLSHLVENVLAFSGIEKGSARAAPATLPAGDLVHPMLERFAERLQEAGMKLSCDPADPAWQVVVKADRAAVEHVLFNLIDNAAKYATGSKEVEITPEPGRDRFSILVRDHGPGIRPSERKRVFRAFHKSAAAAAESRPGVGLGLALSRRLARAGGGDLLLREREAGTCFVLSLPSARD
jgi:signal transduction histidine kinase